MSTTTKESSGAGARDYRIAPSSPWAGAWKTSAAIGVAGLAVAAYGYKVDPARFAFAYLFGFYVSLSLALGSLFFVLVLYVCRASWGVTVRRIAEHFMRPLPLFALLVIPLLFVMGNLFPWLGGHRAAEPEGVQEAQGALPATAPRELPPRDRAAREKVQMSTPGVVESPLAESRGIGEREPVALRDLPVAQMKRLERAHEGAEQGIIAHKSPFMNKNLFLVRLFGYLVLWSWLAQRYFRWSTEQDKTKALENTVAAQAFSPLALILFAFSLTFFVFDWLLSLDATWYSTIFGVYCFAQCALFQMAVLTLVALALRRSGLLGNAVNVEHFHDLGKLLFGWIAFWSYVSFAQFFLDWYGNIPDEVAWFHKRWDDNGGSWQVTSVVIVAMHFFVPFWFLMSRNIKRRLPMLAIGAICMALMHLVDVYWVILPNFGRLAPNYVDVACLVGVFGIYFAAVLRGMVDYSLVPVGDPRFVRSLEFENA